MNNQRDKRPVIFLAFANAKPQGRKYLRDLPRELRGIRNFLSQAKKEGLCDFEINDNVTVSDIFDMFQDTTYQDRIAIFHFAGHANEFELVLDDWDNQKGSLSCDALVDFLGRRQKNLKLVFLNGCCTEQHSHDLRNKGVPSVIGTYNSVKDEVACNLAIRFYSGLARGLTIDAAWKDAHAQQINETTRNRIVNYRKLYRISTATQFGDEEERYNSIPWDLYTKPGSEENLLWSLPKAVNDPLFGLPPLVKKHNLPQNPYLFLHPYLREHAEIYFGRSQDIRNLYDAITQPDTMPVILLYGQSGVGKSSLLEAGLRPRLEESHHIFYHRRDPEIGLLKSLYLALREHGQSVSDEDNSQPVANEILKAWHLVDQEKPFLIFLDQVEEVFTRPGKEVSSDQELHEILDVLKKVFKSPVDYPKGKLILSYRAEKHAHIEKLCNKYGIPVTLYPLERLSRSNIIEVVEGLTTTERLRQQYRLEFNPDEDLSDVIANHLLMDPDSPIATILQIILSKMWSLVVNERERIFTRELYEQCIHRHGIAMEDFFEQQMASIRMINAEWVESGLLLDILKFFVSDRTTAQSHPLANVQERYNHREDINQILQALQACYLLTPQVTNLNNISLAHDTLAPEINKQFNQSDRPGQRAHRILNIKMIDYDDGNIDKNPFSENEVAILTEGEAGMRKLDDIEKKLLSASHQKVIKDKQSARRRKAMSISGIVSLIVMVGAILWGVKLNRNINDQKNIEEAKRYYSTSETLKKRGEVLKAAHSLAKSISIEPENNAYTIKSRIWDYYLNGYANSALISNTSSNLEFHEHIWSNDSSFFVSIFNENDHNIQLFGARKQYYKFLGDNYHRYMNNFNFEQNLNSYVSIGLQHTNNLFKQYKVMYQGGFVQTAISPNNLSFLTYGIDSTLALWDTRDSLKLDTLFTHKGRVQFAKFDDSGDLILSWCNVGFYDTTTSQFNFTGTIYLWDMNKKSLFCNPIVKDGGIKNVDFRNAENSLIIVYKDNKTYKSYYQEWDYVKNTTLTEPYFIGEEIEYARFVANRKYLITKSGYPSDEEINLWDIENSLKPVMSSKDTNLKKNIIFSSDNKKMLTYENYPGEIFLYDVWNAPELIETITHRNQIGGAKFSPSDSLILSWSEFLGAGNTEIMIWHASDGSLAGYPIIQVEGSVTDLEPQFNKYEDIIFFAKHGTIKQYKTNGNSINSSSIIHKGVEGLISNVSESLILSHGGKESKLWSTQNGKEIVLPMTLEDNVAYASYLKNGNNIIAYDKHNQKIWNYQNSSPVFTKIQSEAVILPGSDGGIAIDAYPGGFYLARHFIEQCCILKNGEQFISTNSDNGLTIWNTTTGKPLNTNKFPGFNEDDTVAAFPDSLWGGDKDRSNKRTSIKAFKPSHDQSKVLAYTDSMIKVMNTKTYQFYDIPLNESKIINAEWNQDNTKILFTVESSRKIISFIDSSYIESYDGPDWFKESLFSRIGQKDTSTVTFNKLYLWNIEKQGLISSSLKNNIKFNKYSLHPDNQTIITWEQDDSLLSIWDVRDSIYFSRTCTLSTNLNNDLQENERFKTSRRRETIKGCEFYSNSQKAIIYSDESIYSIDLNNIQNDINLIAHLNHKIDKIFVSHDESMIIALGDNEINIINVETGNDLAQLPLLHESNVLNAILTKNDQRLYSIDESKLYLWDLNTGDKIFQTDKDTSGKIKEFQLDKDELIIFTYSENKINIWNANDGTSIIQLDAPNLMQALYDDDKSSLYWYAIETPDKGKFWKWDISGDLDFPKEHYELQTEVLTGTTLDNNGNLSVLTADEWESLKNKYIAVAKAHLESGNCKYLDSNVWLRLKQYWEND